MYGGRVIIERISNAVLLRRFLSERPTNQSYHVQYADQELFFQIGGGTMTHVVSALICSGVGVGHVFDYLIETGRLQVQSHQFVVGL